MQLTKRQGVHGTSVCATPLSLIVTLHAHQGPCSELLVWGNSCRSMPQFASKPSHSLTWGSSHQLDQVSELGVDCSLSAIPSLDMVLQHHVRGSLGKLYFLMSPLYLGSDRKIWVHQNSYPFPNYQPFPMLVVPLRLRYSNCSRTCRRPRAQH